MSNTIPVIDDLRDYIEFILSLNRMTFIDVMMEKLRSNLVLVGVSREQAEEISKRRTFVEYAEYITEKHKDLLDNDVESIQNQLLELAEKASKQSKLQKDSNLSPSDSSVGDKISKDVTFFYRGQYDSSKGMKTGIYRGHTYKREDYLYHEMLVRCSEEFRNTTHIEKLAIMQHYGCPTRLFDITLNPLVALYFACKNYRCKTCNSVDEGIVYIFQVESNEMVYADSDRALILSCLPRFSISDKHDMIRTSVSNLRSGGFPKNKDGIYTDSVIERLYHEICREVPAFKRSIVPLDLLQPLFVQPEKSNRRMMKQDGAFILTGLSSDGFEEQAKLELMSNVSVRIKDKEKILKQLERIGINEATLFPEMEHVAGYLKERY